MKKLALKGPSLGRTLTVFGASNRVVENNVHCSNLSNRENLLSFEFNGYKFGLSLAIAWVITLYYLQLAILTKGKGSGFNPERLYTNAKN